MRASLLAVSVLAVAQGAAAGALTEEKLRAAIAKAGSESAPCVNHTIYGATHYARGIDAEMRGKCMVDLATQSAGPDDPVVGAALFRLGLTYRDQGRHAEALDYLQKALAHRERAYGPDDVRLLENVEALGATYLAAQEPAKAIPLLRRSLAMAERRPATPSTVVARQAGLLAQALIATQQYAEAERLEARALQLTERAGASHDLERVAYLNGLARAQLAQERPGDADRTAQKAIGMLGTPKTREEKLEKARSLLLLAEIRDLLHRKGEAERLRKEAMAGVVAGELPPPRTPRVPPVLQGGQCDFFEGMAQAVEQFHGGDHPNLAPQLYLLGHCLEEGGRGEEAKGIYDRALKIQSNPR